jgi:hypothetical protein
MPGRYQCPIDMVHTAKLAKDLEDTTYSALGTVIMDALRKDQHMLFHDSEFVDGCDICDRERIEED